MEGMNLPNHCGRGLGQDSDPSTGEQNHMQGALCTVCLAADALYASKSGGFG